VINLPSRRTPAGLREFKVHRAMSATRVASPLTARRARVIAFSCVLALLSGCQVFQPYVTSRHFNEPAPTGYLCNSQSNAPVTGDKADEVAFARNVERQLTCFARQHGEFASATGYALIPLAALVAYQGFKQANPHNIAALSGAGAAAYGIASYQYKPRDVIYLAGVAAVDCAIQVSTPSILSEKQDTALKARYVEFSGHLDDNLAAFALADVRLAGAHRSLVAARAERAGIAAVRSNKGLRDALDDALASVSARATSDQTALTSTQKAMTSLARRYAKATALDTRARKDLVSTTESIVNSVNSQVATMTPNPASLASMLSSLKLPTVAQAATTDPATTTTGTTAAKAAIAMAAAVAAAPAPAHGFGAAAPATPDPASAVLALLASASDQLAAAEAALAGIGARLAPLAGELDALSTTTNLEKLYQECAIEVKTQTPLSIAVPKDGISVKNGGEAINLLITGGVAPYSPAVVNPAADGALAFEIKQGIGNSSVLSMKASGFKEDTDLAVIVQDSGGGSKQLDDVKVTVDDAKANH
jgi:hypothetical protein